MEADLTNIKKHAVITTVKMHLYSYSYSLGDSRITWIRKIFKILVLNSTRRVVSREVIFWAYRALIFKKKRHKKRVFVCFASCRFFLFHLERPLFFFL